MANKSSTAPVFGVEPSVSDKEVSSFGFQAVSGIPTHNAKVAGWYIGLIGCGGWI